MLHKLRQRRNLRKAQKGTGTWGRTELPLKPTITAKVIRNDGSVEHYEATTVILADDGNSSN